CTVWRAGRELSDRDHRIGHAYLMKVTSLDDLRGVFSAQIIPLLQEYFFDDFSRVATVLATAPSAPQFLVPERLHHDALFGGKRPEGVSSDRVRHSVSQKQGWSAESFRGIYEPAATPVLLEESE
ncbi:MAG: hypothetical protein ABI625_15505, partial [bacterium]